MDHGKTTTRKPMTTTQYKLTRERLGLTQGALARLLGVTRKTINQREQGGTITREAAMALELLEIKTKQSHAPSCRWTEDEDGNWDTACGETFTFIDGGPKENKTRFCPYCGGKLETKPCKP
jgi:DNA-binding XRE family transcriptional regulator